MILNFSIGGSASTNYDRQEADACITISQRFSVKGGRKAGTYKELRETGYKDAWNSQVNGHVFIFKNQNQRK